MKKNNWFNRLFYKAEIAHNQKDIKLQLALVARQHEVLRLLKECKTLEDILALHKQVWEDGYQNKNIGPCEYGMFRVDSIATMLPKDVYLGGIWGLSTKPIPFWEERRDEKYGANSYGIDEDASLYEIILHQYKTHLYSNIRNIATHANNKLFKYKEAGYNI